MRVLLADDFLVFRKGVAAVLSRTPGVSVVAEVSNAHQALEAATVLLPDVVILASTIPGDVAETCSKVKAAVPGVRVVLLSGNPQEAERVQRQGADTDGQLLREATVAEWLEALGTPAIL